MNKNILFFLFCIVSFVTSCKSNDQTNELNYMQSIERITEDVYIKNTLSTIQKGDQLLIFVSANNMEVVRSFNPGSEKIYLVDSSGNIDFPILGTLDTTGKTLENFKNELTEAVSKYVKNPNITVKLANFKITILGEVNRPGQYTIPESQSSILNAIGLAGDLTIYGKRDNILMVRSENGQMTKERINLMDPNFINSAFFSLKQGDVIYVSSNKTKEKISKQDPNTGIFIAVAGMIIGLAGIFITVFKK